MKKVGGQKRLQFHLAADDAEALLGDAEVGGYVTQGDALHDVGLLAQQMLVAVAGRARLKTVRDLVHTQDGHRVHLEGEPLCRQVARHQPLEGLIGGHAHHAVLLHLHVRADLFAKEDARQRDVKGTLQVKIVCHLDTICDDVLAGDTLLEEKDAVGMAALTHKKVSPFHLTLGVSFSTPDKLSRFFVHIVLRFIYIKYEATIGHDFESALDSLLKVKNFRPNEPYIVVPEPLDVVYPTYDREFFGLHSWTPQIGCIWGLQWMSLIPKAIGIK